MTLVEEIERFVRLWTNVNPQWNGRFVPMAPRASEAKVFPACIFDRGDRTVVAKDADNYSFTRRLTVFATDGVDGKLTYRELLLLADIVEETFENMPGVEVINDVDIHEQNPADVTEVISGVLFEIEVTV